MKMNRFFPLITAAALALPLGSAAQTAVVGPQDRARFASLPLRFERNAGQSAAQVDYLARGAGFTLFLASGDAVLKTGSQSMRMHLLGAHGRVAPVSAEQLAGYSNYFLGSNPADWRSHVASYERVKYTGVYPGVDLVYYGSEGRLEYDFVVAPAADPRKIRLSFGAVPVRVDSAGSLHAGQDGLDVAFHAPVAYQMRNGRKSPVAASYEVAGGEVGFALGEWDRTLPLVIDPVLTYASYLGGNGTEWVVRAALSRAGHFTVTGITTSTDFPGTKTPYGGGSYDCFVTQINPNGTQLVFRLTWAVRTSTNPTASPSMGRITSTSPD
jgi:hypothetical protein